ncbi:glycosyltransferase [Niveibacterium terrae]|uniref:glycosyltransferase n=1 Tax=Niveibacterium terrae TaxID=3373598 RepID=UPI003A8EB002
MRTIHVLHIVPTLSAGGMELALSRVANGLLDDGITHTVVALKGDALIRERFSSSVAIHCLHAHSSGPGVPLELRRLIREIRPTLIHARNLWAWPEVALARLSTRPMPPLIFSFHGLAEAKALPWRWKMMSRALTHVTTRMFTVSEGSRDFLVDHVGLPKSRIAVIPNGVDVDRFSPRPVEHSRQELAIGTLGSLSPVKNQALLILACHKLIQRGLNLVLRIGGEGRMRGELSALIESLGIADRVQMAGQVSDSAAFLQDLDIFALPSDSEAHPNALSEAMACALPCIASRVGGVPEVTDRGRAALLFKAGDLDALVSGLSSLARQDELRQRLGEAARRYTCEHYSMDLMLKRYRDLYCQLSCA